MLKFRNIVVGIASVLVAGAISNSQVQAQVFPNQAHAAYNSIPLGTNVCTYQQVFAAAQFGSSPIQIQSLGFAPNPTHNGQLATFDNLVISMGYTDAQPGGLSSNLPSNIRGSLTEVLNAPNFQTTLNSAGTEDFSLVFQLTTPFCYDPSSGNLLIQIEVTNTSTNVDVSRCAGVPDASRAYNSSVFGNSADNVALRMKMVLGSCNSGPMLNLSGTCPGTVTIGWSGAAANSTMGIVFAGNTGNYTLPGGPCAGTQLGLGTHNLQLVNTVNTGGGSGSVNGQASQGACGGYLQLVVVGNPCQTSNVAQLP